MMSRSVLLTGGARSGKSSFAQELALKAGGPVLFVATAQALDDEMRKRIDAHRKSRPSEWRTLEANLNVGRRILDGAGNAGTIVIDCITLLVNNVLLQHSDPAGERIDERAAETALTAETDDLITCLDRIDAGFIIVTNEVGLGLVPANKLGRLYRDMLGKANQLLARRVDEVYFMVSGIPVTVKAGQSP